MNIETKIRNKIENMKDIELKEENFKGTGAFGEVYLLAIENTQLAVKYFKTDNDVNATKEQDVLQNIQSIAKDCPGIYSYYGMKKLNVKRITKNNQILNSKRNCLFLQACQGNLTEIPNFPKIEIFNFLSQMSISLFCLHVHGCAHSDLKQTNILYDTNHEYKILYYLTDFGISKFFEENLEGSYFLEQSVRGTQAYFSPEMWAIEREGKQKGNYNSLSADIYALGLICLELLLGKESVSELKKAKDQEDKQKKELESIKKKLLQLSEFQSNPQNEILNILLSMVNFDRKQRPQAIEICQKLIEAKLFTIDALETTNTKALIFQMITSFKPSKKNFFNQKNVQEESKVITIPQNVQTIAMPAMPTFQSDILKAFKSNSLKDPIYSSLILSLFDDSNAKLSKIHHQIEELSKNKFHSDCDNKGSTLVILRSSSDLNCFFGGMAVPSWHQLGWGSDPVDQSSWLFKIELNGKQINLHQWKCINKAKAIYSTKIHGPYFGFLSGLKYRLLIQSELPSNNNYYKKEDLTGKIQNQKSLLFILNKMININCPAKVIGKIMSETQEQFEFSEVEVFTVKN